MKNEWIDKHSQTDLHLSTNLVFWRFDEVEGVQNARAYLEIAIIWN